MGGYTVGVLVQSNFSGVLQIDGVPVGEELKKYYLSDKLNDPVDGSCMIVVSTDAPLDARNLERPLWDLQKQGELPATAAAIIS